MCKFSDIVLNDDDGNPLAVPVEPKCSSAWIDPRGKFYPVRDCGHSEFAEFHFDSYDLESRGWVHLSFGNVYHNGPIRQSQKDTLWDVLVTYREHGYSYTARFEETYNRLMNEEDF